MIRRLITLVVFFLCIVSIGLITPPYTFAQIVHMTGRVFDDANEPISGTEITLRDSSTHTIVRQIAVGLDGQYIVAIPSGIYDITYTPPTGTGLNSQTQAAQHITGNTQYNFTFTQKINPPLQRVTSPSFWYLLITAGLILVILFGGFLFWVKRQKR